MEKITGPLLAWHFSRTDALPHGDGRKIVLGETLSVEGKIVPCEHGLHASVHPYDAMQFRSGCILWRVELSGQIVAHGSDKHAASHRTAVAGGIDVTLMLRAFARSCALDVIHLWKAPDIVRQYLETGDEEIRVEARTTAADAADAAVYVAAYAADAAVYAVYAAADAADAAADAADAAVYAVYAAADAADAARAELVQRFRDRFEQMCNETIPYTPA